jgi:hypothetical protein
MRYCIILGSNISKYNTVCVLLFLCFIPDGAVSVFSSTLFNRGPEVLSLTHPDMGCQEASSPLQCAYICFKMKTCRTFHYSPLNERCQMSRFEGSYLELDPGSSGHLFTLTHIKQVRYGFQSKSNLVRSNFSNWLQLINYVC